MQKHNFQKKEAVRNSDHLYIWQSSISSEVGIWESHLNNPTYLERIKADYIHSPELAEVLDRFCKVKEIEAIDIGCGPLSTLPSLDRGLQIHRTLVDPLGSQYDKFRSSLNCDPQNILDYSAEEISQHFKLESFDLVYMSNALDHSYDPKKVLQEPRKLVSLQGVLYLEHFENEAEKEKFSGLHQWNLFEEKGDLIIADRYKMFSLREILGVGFHVSTKAICRHGGYVASTSVRLT